MFVILDTNHYRELAAGNHFGAVLAGRLETQNCEAFTTIVTIQEIAQGWLAQINRNSAGREQINAYLKSGRIVMALSLHPFESPLAQGAATFQAPSKIERTAAG